MIKHLELMNYRSHEQTSFDLAPMTVFIGPVGGGKSNIFRGLTLLQNAMNRSPRSSWHWPLRYLGAAPSRGAQRQRANNLPRSP